MVGTLGISTITWIKARIYYWSFPEDAAGAVDYLVHAVAFDEGPAISELDWRKNRGSITISPAGLMKALGPPVIPGTETHKSNGESSFRANWM